MPQVSRDPAPLPMQYQVLARKWRPRDFSELVGQPHVSRTLLNSLKSGRVAHAFLFSGPRGSGKTSTARILAKALNCHRGRPGEPCGECPACVEIAAGNCMDVLEIDAASNRGIDEIRELRENVRYQPARDRRKIFIIDEVHMLTPEAFNALLKTLEEPPPHVVFILATTEFHKIPATILSRCQHYAFRLIPYDLILERLSSIAQAEGFAISRFALEQIAFASGGSMRDAMSALDQVVAFSGSSVRDEDVTLLLNLVEPAVLARTVRAIAGNDGESLLRLVAELVDAGQDLQNFCRRLIAHIRSLMIIKAGVSSPSFLGVPETLLPELKEQAGLFSPEDLLRLFDSLVRLEGDLKHAVHTRFHLEMGLLELAQIARLRSLEDLIADFQRLVRGEAVAPERPAASAAASTTAAAPRAMPAPARPAGDAAAAVPRSAADAGEPEPEAEAPAAAEEERRQAARSLLAQITAAVQKESLEPILQSLAGARMERDALILEAEETNEFVRRQLRDNLDAIARAAARVVGAEVRILIEGGDGKNRAAEERTRPPETADGIMERARRDPVVQAFLEHFPGPTKAEKDET